MLRNFCFLLSINLTIDCSDRSCRKNSTHAIKFPVDADPENESHTLVVKSATLGINAEEKERNIVEIHYFDREEKEVRQVLTTLTLGNFQWLI